VHTTINNYKLLNTAKRNFDIAFVVSLENRRRKKEKKKGKKKKKVAV
jgi:hypothetical protein